MADNIEDDSLVKELIAIHNRIDKRKIATPVTSGLFE